MRFTLPLKKVALACNSCAGWVGGAGNLIAVPAVNIMPRISIVRLDFNYRGDKSY